MVVSRPEVAEETPLAGDLPCPRCRGVLRPFGSGRTRTVRGVGADTVTVSPRRARCPDCQVTQILLPTALTVRRADSTEAIGNALVAHARGAGHRSIAARFGRPESTVRRWLRGVREPRTRSGWYRRGVEGKTLGLPPQTPHRSRGQGDLALGSGGRFGRSRCGVSEVRTYDPLAGAADFVTDPHRFVTPPGGWEPLVAEVNDPARAVSGEPRRGPGRLGPLAAGGRASPGLSRTGPANTHANAPPTTDGA
jgi:hypothetical protein